VRFLVLVLDDLQWSDPSTLELLRVLLSEPTLDRFMFIGIFRSDQIGETHLLSKVIRDLYDMGEASYMSETKTETATDPVKSDFSLRVTEIVVENLDLSSIKDLLSELLRGYGNDTELNDLASICLKRTHGNAFFLLQFLSLLYEQKHIRFHLGSLTWKIDSQAIRTSVSPTLNVVDMLKEKMRDLSKPCVEVLKLAAFAGSTFQKDLLIALWEKASQPLPEAIDTEATTLNQSQDNNIDSILATLEQQGYIAKSTVGATYSYKWIHDKIQEAGYSLVPETERAPFASQLGSALLDDLDDKGLESALFVVVNLLNTGCSDNDKKIMNPQNETYEVADKESLARLNMLAGRKALFVSAYESAAIYADQGIALVGKDRWLAHSDLLFQLYSISARAEMLMGRTDKSTERCESIIHQKHIPMEQKFEVYGTLVDNILARGKNARAVEVLLDILSKFGCRFPKNAALVIGSLVKDLLRIKNKVNSIDVRKMKKMNDPTRAELMRLLDKLSACMYIAKDNRLPLVIFRSFNWTLKYGYSDYSPVAFATAGMMLSGILGDLQNGSIYGEKALQLVGKTQSRASAARTMFCVHPALFPWTKPVRTLLLPVIQAYDLGLRSGDTQTAVNAIGYWMVLKFISGVDLTTVEADLRLYTYQMRVLGKDKFAAYYGVKHQGILNLMGRDNIECPTRIQGSIFTVEAECMLRGDVFHDVSIVSWEGLLLFYFGHYTAHAEDTLKHGPGYFAKVHFCSVEIWWDTLLRGISCFEAARLTGKKKYASMAQKMRSKVKKWILRGNPNLGHSRLILDAELLLSRGKHKEAVSVYQNAILYAVRGGHQHEAAIASERLGNLHLSLKETDQAQYRLHESIRYFRDWGAVAVATDRERKYASVLAIPRETGDAQSTISSLSGGQSRPFK